MAGNPFCPILIILHESLLDKTMITMIVGFTVQYLLENDKLKKQKRHSQFFKNCMIFVLLIVPFLKQITEKSVLT